MYLGIQGKAGSGKDELAAILKRELLKYGIEFKRRGLGDPVKQMYMEVTGYTLEEIEANKPAHREALQNLGHSMREINEDYWIQQLESMREFGENTVVPDVRYENEYEYTGDRGVIVRIKADFEVRNARREVVNDDHISEVGCDHIPDEEFDWVFSNNGTIQELQAQAENFVREKLSLFAKAFPADYLGLGS